MGDLARRQLGTLRGGRRRGVEDTALDCGRVGWKRWVVGAVGTSQGQVGIVEGVGVMVL